MKYSFYNIPIPYKNHIVFCNTITLGYVIMTKELFYKTKRIAVKDLHSLHPTLYIAFLNKGIIIDDSVDEYEKLKEMEYNADFKRDSYHLIINPTLDCNFNCWYCFENKHRGSVMSATILEAIKRHIKLICQEQSLKKFTLSFFGGEPLLYYRKIAKPLILELNENKENIKANIHFTTNGFLLSKEIIADMSTLGIASLQITLDGNKENHDKTRFSQLGGSFDKILSNIQLAINNEIEVIARFNYTKDNLWGIHSALERLATFTNKGKITIALNQVWQDGDIKRTPYEKRKIEKELKRIRKGIVELGMRSLPKDLQMAFVNSCYADKKNECLINYDGSIFKCNARDFTEDRKLGELKPDGSIQWNSGESKWMKSKLADQICRHCFLIPICGGGCRRILFEAQDHHYCLYNDNTKEKKRVLLGLLLS